MKDWMNPDSLILNKIKEICFISNSFEDGKSFSSFWIKLLVKSSTFDIFGYQLYCLTKNEISRYIVLILITCLKIFSLNNFLSQYIKSGMINTHMFIRIKINVIMIADGLCIQL